MPKVVVCGLGQVGFRVARVLRRLGTEVTVITLNASAEFTDRSRELGCTIVTGDARDRRRLHEAGVETADALIACTDSDLTNVEISLDAHILNPNLRVIARLFDQILARRLEESVGIHRALAMSLLAAPSFASAALGESVLGAFHLKGNSWVIVQRGGSPRAGAVPLMTADGPSLFELIPSRRKLVGKHIHHVRRRTWRSVVQAWRKTPPALRVVALIISVIAVISVVVFKTAMNLSPVDAVYFVVTTLTTTGFGDISVAKEAEWVKIYATLMMLVGSAAIATLYSILTQIIISAKFDELTGRTEVAFTDHIIVVGLGNVGLRTVEALHAMGADVVAVDQDNEADYRAFLPMHTAFVTGDARDPEVLARAGIDRAQGIIVATDNDAVNLSVGLASKMANTTIRTVVRLFDGAFANKVESALDVDVALSPAHLSAPGFAGAALFDNAIFSFTHAKTFYVIVPKDDGMELMAFPLKDLAG